MVLHPVSESQSELEDSLDNFESKYRGQLVFAEAGGLVRAEKEWRQVEGVLGELSAPSRRMEREPARSPFAGAALLPTVHPSAAAPLRTARSPGSIEIPGQRMPKK